MSGFTISGLPTTTVAGTSVSLTLTAVDAFGNTIPNYVGTVQITSSDAQAVLPPSYTFTSADAGVHTFNVTLKTAGNESVVANDVANSNLAASSMVAVTAGAAWTMSITNFATSGMVGVAQSFTLTLFDAYGNVATGFTGSVQFFTGDALALLPPNYVFTAADAGSHTFSVTFETPGPQWFEVVVNS